MRAYKIYNEQNAILGRLEEIDEASVGSGDVLIKSHYSSVNYKDALAATGTGGRVMSRYPLIAGIDVSGVVISSTDNRFKTGEEVLCTGYGLGVSHDGGFSSLCRVPGDWLVDLPHGLTLYEAMSLGTAGFTAGLAVELLELNGMRPDQGPVLVNGATGGVSSLLINMLGQLGYIVTALTSKIEQADYLKSLGAADILDRNTIEYKSRSLEKPLWSAAFDSVGADQLSWLTKTMHTQGLIASFGNAGGIELTTNVLPFILRGIRLIGIDSVNTPMQLRQRIWQRLATDLKPKYLSKIAYPIEWTELPFHFDRLLHGTSRGRAVLDISGN
jgi:NADPH2:quinone reductase